MNNSTAELQGTSDEVKIISLSFKAIAIIAAILGNYLVFKAFHKFPSLRTASNCILVSRSIADILTVIPFILHIASIALPLGDNIDNSSLHFLCASSARFSLVLISVIILHLALISVERAIAVKFALSKHRKQIRDQANIQVLSTIEDELKGAYTLAIVVGVCFLSFVPLLVVTSFRFFGAPKIIRKPWIQYAVYDFGMGINASFNPVIYGWRHEGLKSAFRKLLRRA
ncbi:uncharacterized protein LOC144629601 [Oculina patagonica]